jgi:hypothetical protein
MAVSDHDRSVPSQSPLLQNARDLGSCFEPVSILDEVCPLDPSSMGDSSSASITLSSFFASELAFAANVQYLGRLIRPNVVSGSEESGGGFESESLGLVFYNLVFDRKVRSAPSLESAFKKENSA